MCGGIAPRLESVSGVVYKGMNIRMHGSLWSTNEII